jgi:lipopolysaccharide biosynthesis protein
MQCWVTKARLRAMRGAEIVGGRLFLTLPVQYLWQRLPRLAPKWEHPHRGRSTIQTTAVVAHTYYPDLLPEILACWQNVRATEPAASLHITTTSEQYEKLARTIDNLTNVYFHVGPNRGRDIAPFLSLLNGGALDPYDVVLKLHTKRSPHLRAGDLRRRLLFTLLAGSPRQTARIRELFRDPRVGMVGWRLAFRNSPKWWLANEVRLREIAKEAVPAIGIAPGFFEGSMFWVRPAALSSLRSLALQPHDFEPERGQLDGALHHAIERLFALSAWAGGYRVHAISGRLLDAGH